MDGTLFAVDVDEARFKISSPRPLFKAPNIVINWPAAIQNPGRR